MTGKEATLVCPTCGKENPIDAKRCMECGRVLGVHCPVCNAMNDLTAGTCGSCGATLDRLESVLARQEITGIQKEWLLDKKEEDDTFMRQERAKLDEEERQRLYRLAVMKEAAQKEQERILLMSLAVIGILAIGGLVVYFFTQLLLR